LRTRGDNGGGGGSSRKLGYGFWSALGTASSIGTDAVRIDESLAPPTFLADAYSVA